jgi:hypothetical protein
MDANQTKVDKILKKMLEAQPWEEKKRWCIVRLFGTNSLKEGAVWHVNPLLGYATEVTQLVSKHQPVNKISTQTRWRHATVLEYGSYATRRDDVTGHQE